MVYSSQDHKKFEEERARLILLHQFPDKYKDTFLSESPDIQSKNGEVGVEVTNSNTSEFLQAMARASSISGKTDKQLTEIDKINIALGRVIAKRAPNEQYVPGFYMWGKPHDLETIYLKKLAKLNATHFNLFQKNNLFIYAWMIDDNSLQRGIDKIQKHYIKAASYSVMFNTIYIFAEKVLIEMDYSHSMNTSYTFYKKDLERISNAAYFNLFGMSMDEYEELHIPK